MAAEAAMQREDMMPFMMAIDPETLVLRYADITERMEVSLRTVYRAIETLIGSRVPITGESGVGYMMTEPVFLPLLNLTQSELEVLELGNTLVQSRFGQRLGDKV